MKGTVFNIQKFSINDGPGIRSTVFLKGCPLNCLWCHNPESKSTRPELFYLPDKCIMCSRCLAVCKNGCHKFSQNDHTVERKNCIACGDCSDACVANALEICGRSMDTEDIMREIMRDEVYYRNSNGGMTVSGGEPFLQADFAIELLRRAKDLGLHTCIETSGYAKTEKMLEAAKYTDIFLFDYKLTDPEAHKRYTGADNSLILRNLFELDKIGAKIILRCPIIPTVNDNEEHFDGIAKTANSLSGVIGIDIEPYHELGAGKTARLGKEYPLPDVRAPEKEKIDEWIAYISSKTKVSVKKA